VAPRPKSSICSCRAATAYNSDAAGEQDLLAVLQRLATIAGIATPQLHIIDDPSPAAFAIGGSPFRGRIVISTGLCRLLPREEVIMTAVLAHEIAHIKQRHCLSMACITIVTLAVLLFAALLALVGYSLRRQGGFFLAALGTIMASGALLLRYTIAQYCEFEADRIGSLICGHPEWLVSALSR
jgi:heat shock protein HtpX